MQRQAATARRYQALKESERRLTAASLLEDAPTHIPTAGGLYIPQNYDRSFKGWVSVRTALGASLNVPAVRTLVMVSPDAFHRQLRAVGLPLRETGDYYGYSLALGSAEVTMEELAALYAMLANQGIWHPLQTIQQHSTDGMRLLSPEASFLTLDMLSKTARPGAHAAKAYEFPVYWKTGTSAGCRDAWLE